jgi:hypothetical protein
MVWRKYVDRVMFVENIGDARLHPLNGLLTADAGRDNQDLPFKHFFSGFEDKVQGPFPPEVDIQQNHGRAALVSESQRFRGRAVLSDHLDSGFPFADPVLKGNDIVNPINTVWTLVAAFLVRK